VGGSGISWAICKSAPHQHFNTQFLQAGCPSYHPIDSIKALKAYVCAYRLLTSFCSTCPYDHNLFYCSTEIMSSNLSLSLSLNPLLGTLSCSIMPHIHPHSHLCPLKFHLFSFLTGQVSLSCNILLRTRLLYNLPLTINDISLLVSNGNNCLNLFHPIQNLFLAASASPSTLNMSPK